jgi:DNA polymerase-3 subunit epsilon
MDDNAGSNAPRNPHTFVAIDFETADRYPDSACAIALVRVENWQITEQKCWLIRPPRKNFYFTYLHGISWRDVAEQPNFQELWPNLREFMRTASFLAAHNAPFDRSVLYACCRAARITPPGLRFRCTMELARQVWKIYPTKLPLVCARLGIPLNHHDAGSDAEACARIVIAASRGNSIYAMSSQSDLNS